MSSRRRREPRDYTASETGIRVPLFKVTSSRSITAKFFPYTAGAGANSRTVSNEVKIGDVNDRKKDIDYESIFAIDEDDLVTIA
ncbi:hypothetical protein Cantr_07331 [Candida viswanathii]|uniref:Uncharacterized protein n=1 Tax=Candida viswanathii TaxID=5486 RepID=A0A367Y0L3_9ASCO|nr:hypothetical protein Cantr_07331 [Candida viswanathii]